MRGLQCCTAWLQGNRRIASHLAFCNRVSTCCSDLTAALPQMNHSDVLPLQKYSAKQESQSKNRSFIYTVIGFGTGLYIGAIVKTLYEQKSSEVPLTQMIPSVSAASPFSFSSAVDSSKDETKPHRTTTTSRLSFNFIADAAEKASDKVVNIDIKDNRSVPFTHACLSVSRGSGFIVSEDGLILTNAHVVDNKPRASKIVVRLHDGTEYEGVVEDIDTISDLALIRVKCKNLHPAPLGKSSDLRPGEFVAALGSPLSLCNTITAGVVSSVGRASKELGLRGQDIQYIQTDAAITFGNSGGPLINMDGEVIGINSMTITNGISFAIPIDYAKEFMAKAEKKRAELAKYPESQYSGGRRYLGITMLTLTSSIVQQLQARGSVPQHVPPDVTHGVFIWRVVIGSPAYQVGLQPGDIITQINNHEIRSSRDVYRFLEGKGELNMTVLRNGQRYFVSVMPEE